MSGSPRGYWFDAVILGDARIERDARDLVAAAEILHVAVIHDSASAASPLRSASTTQRWATTMRERPCGTRSIMRRRRGEQARYRLHRQHEYAVAARRGQPAEEGHHAATAASEPRAPSTAAMSASSASSAATSACAAPARGARGDRQHRLQSSMKVTSSRVRARLTREGRLGVSGRVTLRRLAPLSRPTRPALSRRRRASRTVERFTPNWLPTRSRSQGIAGAQAAVEDLLLDGGRHPSVGRLGDQGLELDRLGRPGHGASPGRRRH